MNLCKLHAGCMLDVTWVAHMFAHTVHYTHIHSCINFEERSEWNRQLQSIFPDQMLHRRVARGVKDIRSCSFVGWGHIPLQTLNIFGSSVETRLSRPLHFQAPHVLPLLRPSSPRVSRGCPVKVHQNRFCRAGGLHRAVLERSAERFSVRITAQLLSVDDVLILHLITHA